MDDNEKKKKRKDQKALEIFIKEFFKTEIASDSWKSEKRFPLKDGSHSYFKVDGYNECLGNKCRGIIWEYDGPRHYNDEKIVERDKRRKDFFISKGYEFIAIPYFCTLTKAVTRHYLEKVFDKIGGNFEEALTNNYEDATNKARDFFIELNIKPPFLVSGWNGSPHMPFGFAEGGKRRFLDELDNLPEETYHQIMYSLTLDLNNSLNKDIIEKIRNFKVKKEHTDGWEFLLEEKKS